MKTYFIGREEVEAYLRDLLARLDPLPEVWCPMTESGVELTKVLSRVAPAALRPKIDLKPVTVSGAQITIPSKEDLRSKSVLLLDSAIHSGRMMTHCVSEILKHEPASLTTYALAVKRCSTFFPTLWGVMTDEGDRPYFLLGAIPNNRLNAGARNKQPPVHIRLLAEEHADGKPIKCGLASIDRVTWSDRLFQMNEAAGTLTYVLERGPTVVGFLTLHVDAEALTIAEVVVDPDYQDSGYGGILLRFAETMARQSDCHRIRLNAISAKVDLYKKYGFDRSHRPARRLDAEEYHPMERLVLYHQGRRHVDGSGPIGMPALP